MAFLFLLAIGLPSWRRQSPCFICVQVSKTPESVKRPHGIAVFLCNNQPSRAYWFKTGSWQIMVWYVFRGYASKVWFYILKMSLRTERKRPEAQGWAGRQLGWSCLVILHISGRLPGSWSGVPSAATNSSPSLGLLILWRLLQPCSFLVEVLLMESGNGKGPWLDLDLHTFSWDVLLTRDPSLYFRGGK